MIINKNNIQTLKLFSIFTILFCLVIMLFKYCRNNYDTFISIENNKIKTLKLKFGTKFYLPENPIKRHQMQNIDQFIQYFLPLNYNYIVVDDNEKSDITIWDIYMDNNEHLRNDEINILICVENVDHWNMYPHYTKYNNYNNDKIQIYLYNHINKLVKNNNYIAIPLIHKYIDYYLLNKDIIKPSIFTPFNNKKFCLMINKSKLNPDINEMFNKLNNIDTIDTLDLYPEIINTSCYHSIELLNVFNKYKFIICFENSYKDGYITEKIFNCFFGHTIPIYKGSPIVNNYIEQNCFVSANDPLLIENIIKIKEDENMYNEFVNSNKISKKYNNENYKNIISDFIENKN